MADDKPQNADFIGRVVSDANHPQETRMLTGWFGDSGEEGFRRLYTDAELISYIDIPDDAILYTEPIKDVQPSGGVIVWIKRDAALKQGGSAASRAARFLQGQVQQDFASAGAAGSLEKAGLRCVTDVPCGEPTGFTGQCTKQPEVGGAWPYITAIPLCFEPTGFTGKCTHAPWPNPTRYIGCTWLHCPTNDLTHIPHICTIVASGNPGCVVVNPPQAGGGPAPKAGDADAEKAAVAETALPGCGYTKSWGVCETHLLGCGYTRDWGNQCPTRLPDCPTAAPGCGLSRNPVCTDLPGCNWTKQPAICNQVDAAAVGVPGPGGAGQPSILCATNIACDITIFCHTRDCTVPPTSPDFGCTQSGPACHTNPKTLCTQSGPACPTSCGAECQSQQPTCTQIGPNCHNMCTQIGTGCQTVDPKLCPSAGGVVCTPICPVTTPQIHCAAPVGAQAFGAAQPQPGGGIHPTIWTQLGPQCPPSHLLGCTHFLPQCRTYPRGDCTFFGCPSPGIDCTVVFCTHFGPHCPNTLATVCTQAGPQCPHQTLPGQLCPITVGSPQCPPASGFNCPSQLGCPSIACGQSVACVSAACQPGGGGGQQAAFAQQAVGAPLTLATVCTQFSPQCPSHLLGCTQFGPQCHTQPPGDCTFFGCLTLARPHCTFIGPGCPPTPATVCTQFAPCHTHQEPRCPWPTPPLTPLCPPPHTFQGQICPITVGSPECPPASGFNCPSQFGCPSIACGQSVACVSAACQPGGGGGQQAAFAQQAVGAPLTLATVCTQFGPQCPHTVGCRTPGIDCTAVFCTHIGPHCPPTPATVCTQTGPQCHTRFHGCTQWHHQCPSPGVDCTVIICTHVGPLCPPNTHPPHCPPPTPLCLTVVGPPCPPHTIQGPACPVLTAGGPQCPPASGFNCPSVAGCQSIACVSAACQPGGGGQQVAQHLAGGAQFTEFENCTQFGPHCPTFFHCPHTHAAVCTLIAPECPPPTVHGPVCPVTSRGPQCPPPASRFHCLSPFCAPGAGQQHGPAQFNAFAAPVAPNFTPACPTVRCHTPFCGPTDSAFCPNFTPACPTVRCDTPFCAPTDRPYCPNFTPSPVWCSRFCPVTEPPNCQPTEALECTRLGPQCPPVSDFVCPSGFCAGGGLGGDPFAGGGGVHPAAHNLSYYYCTWFICPTVHGAGCNI